MRKPPITFAQPKISSKGGSHHHRSSPHFHEPKSSYHEPKEPKHPKADPGVARADDGKILRSKKARDDFMHQHPWPSTGMKSGACPGYVVDHVQALKPGGSDDPPNMQWQTVEDAKEKDKWE